MNTGRGNRDVERLRRVAHWLDDQFRIPGTNIRFGLDSVIGLLPGIGDSITACWGVYFIGRAHQLGVSNALKSKMAANVFVDFLVGAIPIVGDLFDMGFKSHIRNVGLLDSHFASELKQETIKPRQKSGSNRPSRSPEASN